MKTLTRKTLATTALGFALVLLAAPLTAQERPEATQQCTAKLSPAQIDAGSAAVQVTVTLSEAAGPVTGVEAAENSGIALASARDLPRTDMAAEQAANPIAMGESANSWTIWLNTADAKPGQYQVDFTTGAGACTGQVVVN